MRMLHTSDWHLGRTLHRAEVGAWLGGLKQSKHGAPKHSGTGG